MFYEFHATRLKAMSSFCNERCCDLVLIPRLTCALWTTTITSDNLVLVVGVNSELRTCTSQYNYQQRFSSFQPNSGQTTGEPVYMPKRHQINSLRCHTNSNKHKRQRMTTLKSRSEVVAWAISKEFRNSCYEVKESKNDSLSSCLVLHGVNNARLYVVVNSVEESLFVVSMVMRHADGGVDVKFTTIVDYEKSFSKVELPVTQQSLDALFEDEGWSSLLQVNREDTKPLPKTAKTPEVIPGTHQPMPELQQQQTQPKSLPEEIPKFDDEYEIQPKAQPSRSLPEVPSIGDSDLYPAGQKYPSLRPMIDPFDANPNGMIPGRGHPLFGQGAGTGIGGFRGDHPPGARYDDPSGIDLEGGSEGMGLPGGVMRGGPRGAPFGGPGASGSGNPFGNSFGGGFI